ncbi:MAG TPA: hypothetical protein VNF26_07385 [Candidatus Baltobacterales bacterium]|nr:hypothetical protein [Candidatus Baltobacterales bacterium]
MGRRVFRIVLLLVSGVVTVASFAVAPTLIQDRLAYGTFDTASAPPRVDYCGRRYYPGNLSQVQTLAEVDSLLAENGMAGLTRVGTAPSGMPVVTHPSSPQMQAESHTDVCTIELWVQSGPDAYVGYVLSGGP